MPFSILNSPTANEIQRWQALHDIDKDTSFADTAEFAADPAHQAAAREEWLALRVRRRKYVPAKVDRDTWQVPRMALYGRAAEYTEAIQTNLSLALVTILTLFSPLLKISEESEVEDIFQRTNLFGVVMAKSGGGKGATFARAVRLMFGSYDSCASFVQNGSIASDVGLMKAFPHRLRPAKGESIGELANNGQPWKVMVNCDEFLTTLRKGCIQNSGLFPLLNTLFARNREQNQSKEGAACNVTLSILGGLPVTHLDEFEDFFTGEVSLGLMRRMLFAWAPAFEIDESWRAITSGSPGTINLSNIKPVFISRNNMYLYQDWWKEYWKTQTNVNIEGAGELIFRIAACLAAINGEDTISDDCMLAAFTIMDWQLELKMRLKPSAGSTPEGVHTNKILAYLRKAIRKQIAKNGDKWIEWTRAYCNGRFSNMGASVVNRIKFSLVKDGVLIEEKIQEGERWNPTGRVTLCAEELENE
jgi:hypothetical protein